MSQPNVYKVHTSEKLDAQFERVLLMLWLTAPIPPILPSSTTPLSSSSLPTQLALPYLGKAVSDYEASAQQAKLLQAQDKLAEQGRAEDLLEVYVAVDPDKYLLNMTYTFSDRDTALLFKLSL